MVLPQDIRLQTTCFTEAYLVHTITKENNVHAISFKIDFNAVHIYLIHLYLDNPTNY